MPDYRIVFARLARKELESVPRDIAVRILDKNSRPFYRSSSSDKLMDIIIIRHRSSAYR